ncbi:MAG: hypothetical protein LRZ87_01285 [Methanocellales archaeon]|nr:hypothetical protein [Methanocellales archaeon]
MKRLTGRTILITLVVLILLNSAVMPVSAQLNFRVVSEEIIPDRDLLVVEERVSLEVVLEEVSPALTGKTRLQLETELDSPIWTILVNGEMAYTRDVRKFDFIFDHLENDEVMIKLDGRAPMVHVRTPTVLMDIKQVVDPEISDIHLIEANVTSELIEDAISAIFKAMDQIDRAEKAIADAKDAEADVTEAIAYLQTARDFHNSSDALYRAARMNESIAMSVNAYENAVKAQDSAEAALGAHGLWANITTIGIILAIIVIALVVYSKRRWGRL